MEERIARFADIDTRRAMGFGDIDTRIALGFPPCKLPKSELNVRPEKSRKCVASENMTVLRFNTPNTTLIIQDYRYLWVFGFTDTIMMHYDTKHITRGGTLSSSVETYTHPDFNDDGSFKRALKSNVVDV
jgi:hypothetical protein